jgi:hypothetical protein
LFTPQLSPVHSHIRTYIRAHHNLTGQLSAKRSIAVPQLSFACAIAFAPAALELPHSLDCSDTHRKAALKNLHSKRSAALSKEPKTGMGKFTDMLVLGCFPCRRRAKELNTGLHHEQQNGLKWTKKQRLVTKEQVWCSGTATGLMLGCVHAS